MYICRDVTETNFLAVYWEKQTLWVVVKQILDNGDLLQVDAKHFDLRNAAGLMNGLNSGETDVLGCKVQSIDAIAIAGRIAEGMKSTTPVSRPASRISGYWN